MLAENEKDVQFFFINKLINTVCKTDFTFCKDCESVQYSQQEGKQPGGVEASALGSQPGCPRFESPGRWRQCGPVSFHAVAPVHLAENRREM